MKWGGGSHPIKEFHRGCPRHPHVSAHLSEKRKRGGWYFSIPVNGIISRKKYCFLVLGIMKGVGVDLAFDFFF